MSGFKQSLEKEPCECIRCPNCGGRGTMIGSLDDSFRDDDECYACNGAGLEYECERCQMLEELDHEFD